MSLQLAAQHLQQHGRNGDSMLVHMTPKEVKSLNDLAMAHGGQLTINPHTGLPEAGFLSSILPMVAGFALGPAGFGLTQMEAGLASGALSMALNPGGGLMGGLMAGVGAYGGAGLGQSLAQTGMQEATQAELAKNQAFQQAQQAATPQAMGLGNVQEFGIPSVIPKDQYVEMMKEASAPGAQMAQATADRVATDSGFGAPGLTTSTMGNRMGTAAQGLQALGTESGRSSFMNNVGGLSGLAKTGGAALAPTIAEAMKPQAPPEMQSDKDMGQRYTYSPNKVEGPYKAVPTGIEQRYFNPQYQKVSNDQAKNIFGFAAGGLADPGTPTQYSYDPTAQMYSRIDTPSTAQAKAHGNPNDPRQGGGRGPAPMTDAQMAQGEQNAQALGMDTSNPMGMIGQALMGLTPLGPVISLAKMMGLTGDNGGMAPGVASSPGESASSSTGSGNQAGKAAAISAAMNGDNGNSPGGDSPGGNSPGGGSDARGGYIANHRFDQRHKAMATGGLSDTYNLGGYSDGGRLLRGPGDGVSDSIPATIGHKQPARLADGEFVVPARIVSELGNGSTEAGARRLYAMMDRIQKARGSTVGKGKVAKNSRAEQYLPA